MTALVTEEQAKTEFASLMLKHPGNPFVCAEVLCDMAGISDSNMKTRIAQKWPFDPWVISEQKRLLEENGEEFYLPGFAETARLVWGIAVSAPNSEDKLKAVKQYAELRGFIQKQPTVQVTVNKVMQVKDFGNDDEWELKAAAQQRKLLEHSN